MRLELALRASTLSRVFDIFPSFIAEVTLGFESELKCRGLTITCLFLSSDSNGVLKAVLRFCGAKRERTLNDEYCRSRSGCGYRRARWRCTWTRASLVLRPDRTAQRLWRLDHRVYRAKTGPLP